MGGRAETVGPRDTAAGKQAREDASSGARTRKEPDAVTGSGEGGRTLSRRCRFRATQTVAHPGGERGTGKRADRQTAARGC